MKRVLLISVILAAMLLSGCGGTIHNTVAKALAGSPGDFVNFEVVRISPFSGGVTYSSSADQYAFEVYDIERDDIIVVVKSKHIKFEPKAEDFIRIPQGKLVKGLPDDPRRPVYVIAGKVELTSAPEGWRE